MSSLLALLLAASHPIHIDGYGWVEAEIVGICLQDVGAGHEDELYDEKWESFTDCLTWRSGK